MSYILNLCNCNAQEKIRFESMENHLAKDIKNGIHISKMKPGTLFIAPDGRLFQAVYLRTNHVENGKAEYDLEARCKEDGKLYMFHSPVNANRNEFTFQKKE